LMTLATIGWMFLMRPFTPPQIIAFELAGSVEAAEEIIGQWGADGVALARISIGLDFVFLFLYSGSISLGCRVASGYSRLPAFMQGGEWFARLAWFAGSCDLIENVALLITLNHLNELTVQMAFYFAAFKFGIVAISLLFIVISAFAGLIRRVGGR
jgi:hypothetical protein